MSPVAINGVDKQGVAVNGVQVKQALDAANSTVNKGVYDATLLETVDADLAVGNIVNTATIFGKAGTVIPGGTETIEKYADAVLASGATYTPAASGIFADIYNYTALLPEYFSTVAGVWYVPAVLASTARGTAIGDGTNYRLRNTGGGDNEYILFRHYYSTGTYTRERDAQLAAGASWTPATSGFFVAGMEHTDVTIQVNRTTAGWSNTNNAQTVITILIGDGTNLRVYNWPTAARYYVVMRAKLT